MPTTKVKCLITAANSVFVRTQFENCAKVENYPTVQQKTKDTWVPGLPAGKYFANGPWLLYFFQHPKTTPISLCFNFQGYLQNSLKIQIQQ